MSVNYPKLNILDNAYYLINNNAIIRGYANLCVHNDTIINDSNDWLHINILCSTYNVYHDELVYMSKYIINNKQNNMYMDINVIPFITGYNTSIHCFAGIYSILCNYFNNFSEYKNYNIIIYKNLQQGVFDLIYFCCDCGLIDKNKIILLDDNIIYKFKNIQIIPSTLIDFFENNTIRDNIYDMIHNNILSHHSLLSLDKYNLNKKYLIKKIAILKTFDNSITSTIGAMQIDSAIKLSNQLGYQLINLSCYNEIQNIQIIKNCEHICFSWGTTFMKNFIYISDFCKTILVFIIGKDFINQFKGFVKRKILVTKFKNAIFTYKILN